METNKVTFSKSSAYRDDKDYNVYLNDKRIGTICYNDEYPRFKYTIDMFWRPIGNGMRYNLSEAKAEIKKVIKERENG